MKIKCIEGEVRDIKDRIRKKEWSSKAIKGLWYW